MPDSERPLRRIGSARLTKMAVGALAVGGLAVGALAVGGSTSPPVPGAAPLAAAVSAIEPAAGATIPAAVHIPRLGVSSPLAPLGVDETGVLEPPATADVAGWHTAGTVPGEVGPAVVAGHVDSRSGPGVFVDLPSLVPGDDVEIVQVDGTVLTFTVESTETVDKAEFPTERVYGPTPLAELRLITCGGWFDAADGHYVANVIVRATLQTGTGDAPWSFER